MPAEEFIYHKVGDGSYVRKTFGMETTIAHLTDAIDGCSHIYLTTSVTLHLKPPTDIFKRKVKEAWIALRHQIPGLACRAFRLPNAKQQFAFRYNAPRSKEDVEAWALETVFFSDETKTLMEWSNTLKERSWWFVSSNKYSSELHVSPMEDQNEWHFSMSLTHANGDGRGLFQIFEVFLDLLAEAFQSEANISEELKWGDEVTRLMPPSAFIPALVATGKPPVIPDDILPPPMSATDSPLAMWSFPVVTTGKEEDASFRVKFSAEETIKIVRAAKAHGSTVTQALSALVMLAFAESNLKTAVKAGEERFQEVVSSYEAATHHNMVLNPWDVRYKLPGGYNSFSSSTGAPLSSFLGTPLSMPIDGIKKLLALDRERKTISRTLDNSAFWDVLVKGIAGAWKNVDTSLEASLPTSLALQGMADYGYFKPPEVFNAPHTVVSCPGDLDRLNILSKHLPSRTFEGDRPLTLNDALFSVRTRIASLLCFAYTIGGELTCYFSTSLEYHTQEEFDMTVNAFVDWTRALFQFVH